jgi:hypothetical protein
MHPDTPDFEDVFRRDFVEPLCEFSSPFSTPHMFLMPTEIRQGREPRVNESHVLCMRAVVLGFAGLHASFCGV